MEKNKSNKGIVLPDKALLEEEISTGIDVYSRHLSEAGKRAKALLAKDAKTYVEKHHIIPRHAGGSDDSSNLVFLTYEDHVIAHYIRWVVFNDTRDQIAWKVMLGDPLEVRRLKQSLAGQIGGQKVQELLLEANLGWYNSQIQSELGKKGAQKNREQGTGGFDPKNLEKANEVQKLDPAKYLPQKKTNLVKGLETQKEKGINVYSSIDQRRKSLQYHGIRLNGVLYSLDTEQRTYISETALDYYLLHAPKRPPKK